MARVATQASEAFPLDPRLFPQGASSPAYSRQNGAEMVQFGQCSTWIFRRAGLPLPEMG